MFSRPYELTELKLPIDAVDSSKSFAVRKSRVLTEKLTASASCSTSGQYHRNISIAECIKGCNEQHNIIMNALNGTIMNVNEILSHTPANF